MESNHKFSPATFQEFCNLFVPDPTVRIQLEEIFEVAARTNPYTARDLEKLKWFAAVYENCTLPDSKKFIAAHASIAVREFINLYRQTQNLKGEASNG